jgi:hypothetical protein
MVRSLTIGAHFDEVQIEDFDKADKVTSDYSVSTLSLRDVQITGTSRANEPEGAVQSVTLIFGTSAFRQSRDESGIMSIRPSGPYPK